MPKAPDSPAVARRREREKRVVSQMIALSCRAHHQDAARRTELCPHMATKTSCNRCATHCYPPAMREQIRAVMRFAGPRMLLHHPIAAVRHLLGT